jgi:hypothetical protein
MIAAIPKRGTVHMRHARQLKASGGMGDTAKASERCTHYGREKTSALWQVRPLVMLPHAPSLSHTLPAD